MLPTIPNIQALMSALSQASSAEQETHSLLQDIETLTYLATRETNRWNIAGGTGMGAMGAYSVRIQRANVSHP